MTANDAQTGGRPSPAKAMRGLALGLTLSVLNLAGAFLTLTALGGLGDWSGTQFMGMFGVIEIATGAAFIIGPNIWRLPVAEWKLERRPEDVQFAASTVLIPHWAGGVKCVAGFGFLAFAAVREGVAPGIVLLPLVVVGVCAACVGLSMLAARLGTAFPQYDVFEITIRRPGHEDNTLPGQSVGASIVQFLLSITTFPAIKVLPSSILFSPKLEPSSEFVLWVLAVGGVLLVLGFAAWWGRLAWQAPRPQQREAEEAVGAAAPTRLTSPP